MSKVRLSINLEIRLNQDQQEKYKVKSDVIYLQGSLPIRAEVEKNGNIYYLGSTSLEDFDLAYALGKGNTLKFYNQNNQEIDHAKFYAELESQILSDLNQEVNAGTFDTQIKERYTKGKDYVKVNDADVRNGRHRKSAANIDTSHNWIPTDAPTRETKLCPEFSIFDDRTQTNLGTFNSIYVCCHEFSINAGNVIQCLRNQRSLCEGYSFKFTNENSPEVANWLAEQQS